MARLITSLKDKIPTILDFSTTMAARWASAIFLAASRTDVLGFTRACNVLAQTVLMVGTVLLAPKACDMTNDSIA